MILKILSLSLILISCSTIPIYLKNSNADDQNITNLHISRVYTYVNVNKPIFKTQPKHFQFADANISNYIPQDLIGAGAFSHAYIGYKISDKTKVILKILKENAKTNINKEIMILKELRNKSDYIVQMLDASRLKPNSIIVYNYLSTITFNKIAFALEQKEFKEYMRQILLGIEVSHQNGIMHRDLKLGNIIVKAEERHLQIIDWGLGEFYFPNKEYSTKAGTRYYKGPELLLGNRHYDYSVDMWSFGCIFAGIVLMFHKHPFFRGIDLDNQLVKIAKILGTKDLFKYVSKYQLEMKEDLKKKVKIHRKKNLKKFVNEDNKHLTSEDALDFLSQILVYDHQERLSAREALQHRYFQGDN